MKRVLMISLVYVAFSAILNSCSLNGTPSALLEQRSSRQITSSSLEGAYEFVSETITLTEPRQHSEERSSSGWAGLWLFKGGHFSESIMRKPHSAIDINLAQGPREYGFEGSAGTYQVERSTLELKNDLSIYPLAVNDVRIFQLRLEGNELTLTEVFMPNRESQAKGNRVLVLRRIER